MKNFFPPSSPTIVIYHTADSSPATIGDDSGNPLMNCDYTSESATYNNTSCKKATYTVDDNTPIKIVIDDAKKSNILGVKIYKCKISPNAFNGAFKDCTNMVAFKTTNIDTTNVTNMSNMFYDCRSLTTIDVSNWDTSKVTNMRCLFYWCSKLTTLDVSNWDTSKVTDMNSMFFHCNSLTTLDASNWNTSKVTNMRCLFYWCSKLTTLDVSNWDTSNVTDMSYMFDSCSSLTILNVSKWNISNVTDMVSIFNDCRSLTTLDVSNWDTSKVINMSDMFSDCRSLTTLDVSKWNTSNVTYMWSMFYNCKLLTTIGNTNNWDLSSLTSMTSMFRGATSITGVILNNIGKGISKLPEVFYGCANLSYTILHFKEQTSINNIQNMYYNNSKIKNIEFTNMLLTSDSNMTSIFDGTTNNLSRTGIVLKNSDSTTANLITQAFNNRKTS